MFVIISILIANIDCEFKIFREETFNVDVEKDCEMMLRYSFSFFMIVTLNDLINAINASTLKSFCRLDHNK